MPQNPFSLEGRTVLIAGASRGIGLAIAQSVARAGADTILAARTLDALEAQAQALVKEGAKARALKLDITNLDDATLAAIPELDGLVTVAGINQRKPFETYTREEFDRIMETNINSVFVLVQKLGGRMKARGKGGKIVIVGSQASNIGLPFLTPYSVSKTALVGLTHSLAAEWGRYDIQVNCIAPGFILTDLNRKMWQEESLNKWREQAQANPRMGLPEDIGPLGAFLCAPGSDYITGQVISVDGGYSKTAIWPFQG